MFFRFFVFFFLFHARQAPSAPPPLNDAESVAASKRRRVRRLTGSHTHAHSHPHTALIRNQYLAAERKAASAEARLHTAKKGGNWDGDVYMGSVWNEATVLGLIAAAVPLAGLVFAVATKGTLWGLVDYYGM